jgi:hypothetical protein
MLNQHRGPRSIIFDGPSVPNMHQVRSIFEGLPALTVSTTMELQIKSLAAVDLSSATAEGWGKCVKSLLASGVDPTGLYQGEVALPSLQNDAAADTRRSPDFYFESSEMPALRRAISIHRSCQGSSALHKSP